MKPPFATLKMHALLCELFARFIAIIIFSSKFTNKIPLWVVLLVFAVMTTIFLILVVCCQDTKIASIFGSILIR